MAHITSTSIRTTPAEPADGTRATDDASAQDHAPAEQGAALARIAKAPPGDAAIVDTAAEQLPASDDAMPLTTDPTPTVAVPIASSAVTGKTPSTPQPRPASPQTVSNVKSAHKPSNEEIDLLAMLQTDPDDVEVDLHDMLRTDPPPSSVNRMTTTTYVITPSSDSPPDPATSTATSGATTARARPETPQEKKTKGPRLSKLFAGTSSRRSSRAADTPRSARDAGTPRTSKQATPRVHFSMMHGEVPAFVAAQNYGHMMKLCKSAAGFEATHTVLQDWIVQWPESGKFLTRKSAQARIHELSVAREAITACNAAKPREATLLLVKLLAHCEKSKTLPAFQMARLRERAGDLQGYLNEGPLYMAAKQLETVANMIVDLAIDPLMAPLALTAQQTSTGKDGLALLSSLTDTQCKNLFRDADWVEQNKEWLEAALGDNRNPHVAAERKHQLLILRMAQGIQADALKGDYDLVALSNLHTAMQKTIDVNGAPEQLVNVGSELKAVERAFNPMSAEAFLLASGTVITSILSLLSFIPDDKAGIV